MSTESNNLTDDVPLFDDDTKVFYSIQFWIFLFLLIPSVICSIFGLYYSLRDQAFRNALHNHIIIVLLALTILYEMTDLLLMTYYFRNFETFTPPPIVRLLWGYVDWGLYNVQIILYAWATIERHVLIFHNQLVSTSRKRLFIHYLPPVFLISYNIVYYTVIFFGIQCENDFVDLNGPSFYPCAYSNNTIFLYDTVMQGIVPIFIIVLSSVSLLGRVFWQKYFVRQQLNWRRYGKMTIQVLSISAIYLVFPFPFAFIVLVHLCGVSADFGAIFLLRAQFFPCYTIFLFPLVVVMSSPELRNKFRKVVPYKRAPRTIAPTLMAQARMTINRTVHQ